MPKLSVESVAKYLKETTDCGGQYHSPVMQKQCYFWLIEGKEVILADGRKLHSDKAKKYFHVTK
jgi:hypothetical protein